MITNPYPESKAMLHMTMPAPPAPPASMLATSPPEDLSAALRAVSARPALLHDHKSAIETWHTLLNSLQGAVHHPTTPFKAFDCEGWGYHLILWGTRLDTLGYPHDAYVVRVTDEENEVVGYL